MKGCYNSNSVEETWEIAKKFAATLHRGDVIRLEGDLGAGKTTFVQGLASALGVSGRVTSPTFCIVREHARRASSGTRDQGSADSGAPDLLVHMDLYRLTSEEDVLAIGWDEYLSRGAIIAVEWPERAGNLIPKDAKRVVFGYSRENEEKRQIAID